MRRWNAGVFFAAMLCNAAQWGVIPSDAAHVSPAEKRAFLADICPGHESDAGCSVCPEEMPPSAQNWELRTAIFGHFQSPTSEDALVSGFGCEPHSNLMSGAYLFTKQGSSWRKVRYTAAENADDCKKLPGSDGRDLLVCESSDMHQGVADWFLYLMDAGRGQSRNEDGPLQVFFGIEDSFGSCVNLADGGMTTGRIESVSFVPASTVPSVRIIVTARLGKAVLPDKAMKKCQPGREKGVTLTTVPRRYVFLLDGRKITPARGNPPMESTVAVAPKTSYRLP